MFTYSKSNNFIIFFSDYYTDDDIPQNEKNDPSAKTQFSSIPFLPPKMAQNRNDLDFSSNGITEKQGISALPLNLVLIMAYIYVAFAFFIFCIVVDNKILPFPTFFGDFSDFFPSQ